MDRDHCCGNKVLIEHTNACYRDCNMPIVIELINVAVESLSR